MKKIAIIVTTPPSSHLTKTALTFVKDAINDFNVIGVFFYQAGVLNAAKHIDLPSDEVNITKDWGKLALEHCIALHLCSTAAERYGLPCYLANGEPDYANIVTGFEPSGLGEMVTLVNQADRVIQL